MKAHRDEVAAGAPGDGERGATADTDGTTTDTDLSAFHAAVERGGEPIALLRRCIEALVPGLADGCELDLRDDRGIIRIVAAVDSSAAERREQAPVADVDDHPIVAVLAGGPARLIDIDDPATAHLLGPADEPTSARALGITTAVLAPIAVGGRVVGSLAVGRGPSGRRFGAEHTDVVVDLGRRLGLAWHNAVLLSERASILASLHDGLVVCDGAGTILEVNDRWCELTGFTAADCIGTTFQPTPSVGESRGEFTRADGSTFPGLVSVAPVVDRSTGEPRGLVASIKDLTAWDMARADLDVLQRVTGALASARSVADVAAVVVREARVRLDAGAAYLIGLAGDGQHLELLAGDGPLADQVTNRGLFPIDRTVPASTAVRDGVTVVAVGRDAIVDRFPDVVPEAGELGVSAVVAVPVPGSTGPRAALSLWWTTPRSPTPAEVALLEAMAAQCGQALVRAAGYDLEHRTSQVLQSRLLSDVPVLDERAVVASRYRPAGAELAVGGDWYDVVHLGPERLAVVVGDVVGSGIDAAAVMGQLRSALKGITLVAPEPVALLSALDRVASGTEGAPGATVCYVVLDLAAGRVEVARAGHPPPLVAGRGGGARFVDVPADPPLGYARSPRRSTGIDLATGDALVLYTDGLVERRDARIVDRLEVLRAAAAVARRASVEELIDDLVAACDDGSPRRDDLAVLVVRDEPAGPDRFRTLVPARSRELSGIRRGVRTFLAAHGVGAAVVEDVVLATSETATNAMEHAYRDPLGRDGYVGVSATVDGGVARVEVRDAGRWKDHPSETTRGRGLTIARSVLADVTVRSGPSGTTVTLLSRA